MVYVDDECGYGAALDDLRHDLLACDYGPGFFRQGDVVLFPLFLSFFLFCFVLKCFDGANGDALRILYGCCRKKKPFAVITKMFEILFGFISPLNEVRFLPFRPIVAPDLFLLHTV